MIVALLVLLAAPVLPPGLTGLQFGMSRAQAERTLQGAKKQCREYGEFKVGEFCVVLLYSHDELEQLAIVFENVDEAHAKLTRSWGPPVHLRAREVWVGDKPMEHIVIFCLGKCP